MSRAVRPMRKPGKANTIPHPAASSSRPLRPPWGAASREEGRDLIHRPAPWLSYADATALPGLINCHVQLAFDTSADPITAVRQADDLTLAMQMAEPSVPAP